MFTFFLFVSLLVVLLLAAVYALASEPAKQRFNQALGNVVDSTVNLGRDVSKRFS